jgi:hypothetical protein
MLVSFYDHRIDKLPPRKQAHAMMCEVVNTIGQHYSQATLSERVHSALSFIGMGFALLQWALLPNLRAFEPIKPALYDSVTPEELEAAQARWIQGGDAGNPLS